MSNLLQEYLTYQEDKDKYTKEECALIRKEFLKKCDEKIKKYSKHFLDAVDNINE